MEGATATEDGTAGLVPAPEKGERDRYLRADGIWTPASGGDADTVDGFHASKENAADTIVARAADGSVEVGTIISDMADDGTAGLSQFIGTNGVDGRYRGYPIDTVKANMGNFYIQTNRMFAGRLRSTSSNIIKYAKFLEVRPDLYSPYPMIFKIANRSYGYIKVVLSFHDSAIEGDSSIRLFECVKFDRAKGNVYAARLGAMTWGLYMDAGNCDVPSYSGVNLPDFGLTQCDEAVRSLPDGYIEAIEVASIP